MAEFRSNYMDKKSLFTIPSYAPRPGTLDRVLAAVYARQQASRLWRVRIFATTAALSVGALVPMAISMVNAFSTSNFATYVSLIFSDVSVVSSYWKEIGASLIESLPAVSLMLTLALVGTFLWSLRSMMRYNYSII
jgi:hypothetical protein